MKALNDSVFGSGRWLTRPWAQPTAWVIVVLLVGTVAFAARSRWSGAARLGSDFFPQPGGLELAAEAQALAQFGTRFLRIGNLLAPPRYAPGWPVVLSAALRAGVRPTDLWRVTAVFGALGSVALGLVAACVLRLLLAPRSPDASTQIAVITASAVSGLLWALLPAAVAPGRTIMNDEPAIALLSISMAIFFTALASPSTGRREVGLMLVAGVFLGAAWTVRPIVGLLAIPLGLALLAWRRGRTLATARSSAFSWGLGIALPACGALWLQARSGLPPFDWSGYTFWFPRWFAEGAQTFDLSYAFSGNPTFPRMIGERAIGHLEFGLRALVGLHRPRPELTFGSATLVAGWSAALAALVMSVRRGDRPGCIALVIGLGWGALHLAFFSLYFFPAERFFLPVMAVAVVTLGVWIARLASKPRRTWMKTAVALYFGLMLTLVPGDLRRLRQRPVLESSPKLKRNTVRRWMELSDGDRRGRVMPFDPLRAQAMGFLGPEVVEGIGEWGVLPANVHVRRLREQELLPAEPSP